MSLFLVHGFTGSPESWRPVIDALGPGTGVEAFRIAGHGIGAPPARSFVDEADRLAKAIVDSGCEHVVGYSLGGRLALGASIRHPELWRESGVRRLTLLGAHPGLSSPASREQRAAADERWAECLERSGIDVFLARWREQPVFEGLVERVSSQRLAEDERIRRGHRPGELAGALRALSLARMPDWTPRLSELELAVELVVGEIDRKFRELAQTMSERLPDARLSVVAKAGHNLPLEAPEAVAQILAAAERGAHGDGAAVAGLEVER